MVTAKPSALATGSRTLWAQLQYRWPVGLISELHFEAKDPNEVQRATQQVAASRPGAWAFQRTLHPIDKALYRLTQGRLTVPGLMAGLPVIMVTTTGAKTGKDRTMPLVGIPVADDIAIIGSNFGQKATPGWVYNLRAKPDATIAYGAESVEVTARSATEDETEQAFQAGAAFYGGFPKYRERASHREIEVFVLEPRQT